MEKIVRHFYKNLSNFLCYINGKKSPQTCTKNHPSKAPPSQHHHEMGPPYSAIASRPASAKRKSSAQTDWARKTRGKKIKNVGCVYSIYFLYVYELCDMNNVCFMYIYICVNLCVFSHHAFFIQEKSGKKKKRNAF